MPVRKKNTALTWILKEAKRLRREYPKRFKTWREYVAQASAIYSSKHHGHSPVGHKHKTMPRKTAKKKSHKARSRVAAGSGISTNSRRHTDYNRNKVNITVGAVRNDISKAKKKVLHLIGEEAKKQFTAVKTRVKKKIAKRIRNLKSQYRRLSA